MKSISIPFRFEKGGVATTEDIGVVSRQRIADVLATRPNERVNLPEYGGNAYSLLFEPVDPLIFADYKVDALQALNRHVSTAQITDMIIREAGSASFNNDGGSTLQVTVVYDTPGTRSSVYTVFIDSEQILTEESNF
jgi:phage baseplate assembly protein W